MCVGVKVILVLENESGNSPLFTSEKSSHNPDLHAHLIDRLWKCSAWCFRESISTVRSRSCFSRVRSASLPMLCCFSLKLTIYPSLGVVISFMRACSCDQAVLPLERVNLRRLSFRSLWSLVSCTAVCPWSFPLAVVVSRLLGGSSWGLLVACPRCSTCLPRFGES